MRSDIPDELYRRIQRKIVSVEGWLLERELQFLATAASNPTCQGNIVEIGSFQGRSTIVIAEAAHLDPGTCFVTIDPFPKGIRAQFDANLARAGLADRVVVHQMMSDEFIATWDRPIRMLFHDGSNNQKIVSEDVARLRPHFVDGAIICFHDVLNPSGERAACFLRDVLASDHFGPFGFCGSIGWGQYFANARTGEQYRAQRLRMGRRLARLLPFLGRRLSRFERMHYKLLRASIPHRRVKSDTWIRAAA